MDSFSISAQRRISTISSHLCSEDYSIHDLFVTQETSANGRSLRLEGQVAIVTGSGQGIGESAAYLFAKEGAYVVVTDLDSAKAEKVVQNIVSNGGKAIAVAGDITDPKFPDKLIDATIKNFGKINIIVNNAGYTWDGMLHKLSDKQWDAMLAVHNTAPFRIIRAAAPYMRDEGKKEIEKDGVAQNRCIINISSTSGIHGNIGQANYSTAKMGVLGLTKTVAKEWGMFGVRCNAIAFGMVDTRLTQSKETGAFIEVDGQKVSLGIPGQQRGNRYDHIPLKRAGKPDEAAASIVMLASPLASYITGHCLEVTGGFGI